MTITRSELERLFPYAMENKGINKHRFACYYGGAELYKARLADGFTEIATGHASGSPELSYRVVSTSAFFKPRRILSPLEPTIKTFEDGKMYTEIGGVGTGSRHRSFTGKRAFREHTQSQRITMNSRVHLPMALEVIEELSV